MNNKNDLNGDKVLTSGSNQVDLQVEQALLDLNELKTEAIKTKNCISASARRPGTTASQTHLGLPRTPNIDGGGGTRCSTEQAQLLSQDGWRKPPPQIMGNSPEQKPMNTTGMSSTGFHRERGSNNMALPSVTQQSFF